MKKLIFLFSLAAFSTYGQVKISDMPAASTLSGVEILPIVQGGVNKKATVDQFNANNVSLLGSYSNPSWITGLAWSKITSTPTTIAGYGITDFNSLGDARWPQLSGSYSNPSWITSLPWSKLTSTPTTIAGYGITDFNSLGDARWPQLSGTYNNPTWLNQLAWGKITSTPTTIAGYGITDFNSLGDARWWLKDGATELTATTTVTYNPDLTYQIVNSSSSNRYFKNIYSDTFSFRIGAESAGSYGTGILLLDNTNLRHILVATAGIRINVGSDATGDFLQRNPSGYLSRLASVSAGSFLRSAGTTTESAWSTVKLPNTISANSIWVANSANTVVELTPTGSQSIRRNSGNTAWEAYTPAAAYTTEEAQDAVGAMVDGSLTYVDGTPLLQRNALTGAITASAGSNTTALGSFTVSQLSTAISDADISGTNTGDQTSIVGITGTTAQFNTALSDNDFATLAGSEAVTNKILDQTNKLRFGTRTQSGTTYTIQASDEGYDIYFTGTNPTVTLPDGLSTNFWVNIYNDGAGIVTVEAATTLETSVGAIATIENDQTGANFKHIGSDVWKGVGALGSGGGGSGDVVGPASATDNAIVRYDATTGKLIQNSAVFIDDNNDIQLGTGTAGTVRQIQATGTDTDIDVQFYAKGAGTFRTNKSAVLQSDAGTNNATEVRTIERQSTGTVAAGFGVVDAVRLENASGSVGIASRWTYTYSTPTNAAEVSTAKLTTKNAGSDFDMINVDGNKLGLFAATPVVKQSAVTTQQGIADALVAYGLLPTSTIASGYSINVQALTSSPADAATIYFGTLPKAPTTSAAISKIYIRKTGTIKIAELYCYSGTAGTNESWSIYIRLNNTTDTLIGTLAASTSERVFSNTGLSIAVTAGDYIEIKSVNPTWATNPLTTIFGGYIYIE